MSQDSARSIHLSIHLHGILCICSMARICMYICTDMYVCMYKRKRRGAALKGLLARPALFILTTYVCIYIFS